MTTAASDVFDPQLLRALRAAPWLAIERRFAFILAASIGLHVLFAAYVAAQPMPPTETQVDELADRVSQRVTFPPLLKVPRLAPASTAPTAARPDPSAPRSLGKPVDKGQAARDAVMRVLGSSGPNGVFSDLLTAPVDEISEALRNAQGRVIVSTGLTGPKGPVTGNAVTVERLGTEGVKKVTLGTRSDKGPSAAVAGPIVIEDDDTIDPRVLQQFITARRAAVQSCYERELHHNPAMKGGKVVLRLAIGAGGRVSALTVEEDTLGSAAVSACMATLMKRWIFPVSPKDELPVSVPFIFARAN